MKLTESMRRGVFDSFVGGVINRFKLKGRRDVLVFEDILAGYVKRCQDAGQSGYLGEIASYWGGMTMQEFLPGAVKRLPITFMANSIAKSVWSNIGLLDDLSLERGKGTIKLETKNEYITRVIGPNSFMPQAYRGILSAIMGKELELGKSVQDMNRCVYHFRITERPYERIETKGKEKYNELNQRFFEKGKSFREVVKMRMFRIKNNRIFFRNRSVIPLENTIFSIIGNRSVMTEEIVPVSKEFFSGLVGSDKMDGRLKLIKGLMQIMGWGKFSVVMRGKDDIVFEVKNMPFGLQPEDDNWNFPAFMILGFLKLSDDDFSVSIKKQARGLTLTYSR